VGSRFSVPVQTGPGTHPAFCTIGTRSFPRVKYGRGVTLTTHPLLVPWSWKGTAIPLLPPMGRTACTETQCLYRGVLYLFNGEIQCVPLAPEPGISLIIITPMKILQRNLYRGTFIVWEMKGNVSVVCVCSAPNCCDMEQRSASQPDSVASGTHCIYIERKVCRGC
jgi:hypothetical protein